MSELDIYDPPSSSSSATVVKPPGFIRGKLLDFSSKIRNEVNNTKETFANAEQKVLSTVKPVTRFIPLTYDTVKRVSVISLCTLSGVLQGRKAGGFRRILYPMCGFAGGSTACYPKQTYAVTTKSLKATLPLVPIAGQAAVDGSRFVFRQTKRATTFIYDKVSEQFPAQPEMEAETPQSVTAEVIQEVVLVDDSADVLEDSPTQPETEVLESEEVKKEVTAVADDSSDKVLAVEKLDLPAEVPPIEENLGMGDRDHDDMYSTRSSRS